MHLGFRGRRDSRAPTGALRVYAKHVHIAAEPQPRARISITTSPAPFRLCNAYKRGFRWRQLVQHRHARHFGRGFGSDGGQTDWGHVRGDRF